jgi:hypothetical protein
MICCEEMGIELSLLRGLELFQILDDKLKADVSDAEILCMPTNISSEAEFHSRVGDLLNKLVNLFGLTFSLNRTRGGERLHAVVSPAEFRWVGGVEKMSVGAMSLSLQPNPSEMDAVLIVIVSLEERPSVEACPGCSNKLLYQFKGRNGWMGGPVDPVPEHFFHAGRPQYNRFSKNPQPAFDMKRMVESEIPDFERFLEGNTFPSSGGFYFRNRD